MRSPRTQFFKYRQYVCSIMKSHLLWDFSSFSVHTTLRQKQENYELKEEDGDRETSARDGDSIVSEGSLY